MSWFLQKVRLSIALSLGIAEVERGVGETVSSLLNKADKALYQAKGTGRNKIYAK